MANKIIQRRVDAAEGLGYDTSPEPHHHKHCACGYSGQPEAVIPYSEMEESDEEYDVFVCPGCGDA